MFNPYFLMALLYLFVAVLAALDASFASFNLLPWFQGIRWLENSDGGAPVQLPGSSSRTSKTAHSDLELQECNRFNSTIPSPGQTNSFYNLHVTGVD